MGQRLVQKFCNYCGKQTAHFQQRPNHLLHLFLSVITAGLWLIPWAIMSMNHKTPKCSVCGQKAGSGKRSSVAVSARPAEQPAAVPPALGVPNLAGADVLDVVGEKFCEDVHRTLFGDSTGEQAAKVALIRMADNPADPNAIGVFVVETTGAAVRRVGFLDRDAAAEYAPSLDAAGGKVECNAAFYRNDPEHVWSVDVLVDINKL